MKRSIDERVKELKKHLDSRPSMCKHCKSKTDNGNMEYICGRTEKHTFFGVKADKCYGDCDLYEKDIPEKVEDTIYFMLKKQIEKLKPETQKTETDSDIKSFESGYLQCQKDILKIVDEMSSLRRNKK